MLAPLIVSLVVACTAPGVDPANPMSVAAAVQAGALPTSCLVVDPSTWSGRYAWSILNRPVAGRAILD